MHLSFEVLLWACERPPRLKQLRAALTPHWCRQLQEGGLCKLTHMQGTLWHVLLRALGRKQPRHKQLQAAQTQAARIWCS